jgi:ParB family chromosome partitioning protein
MSESNPPYVKGELYQIDVNSLQTDPNQPRKHFDPDAQQDLVDSFQKQGVLQPILFRVDQDNNLFIVAGERRLHAAKEAKLETIPALLVEGDHSEIALVENLLREDLTAIELAEALNNIQTEHQYTQEQLTAIIGKAKSTVSDILTLMKLPQIIRDECRNSQKISRQVLINIAKKKHEKGMLTAFEKYKANEAKKQTKETSILKPKVKKTFKTKFTVKFNKIKAFMTGINLKKLDDVNKKDLSSLVQELKKAADDLLKEINKAPTAVKTKPVAKGKTKKGKTKNTVAKTGSKSKTKK